jgi:hypothetical protein
VFGQPNEVRGAPAASPIRFDLLATDALGSPFLWRMLAEYNDVHDPLRVATGTVLAVPPGLGGGSPPITPTRAGDPAIGP